MTVSAGTGGLGFRALSADTNFDVAVIGGGAAGLYSALIAAERGAEVIVVSRKQLTESSSYWAQGGVAAAIGPDDSAELHVADTRRGGPRLVPRVGRGDPGRRGAGGHRRARAPRGRLRPRPRRRARAGTRGRPLPPPRRPRRRGRHRAPDHRAPRPPRRGRAADPRGRGHLGAGALERRRALPRRDHGRGARAGEGDHPRHRGRRRTVGADDQPLGSDRRRLGDGQRGRRRARRPRALPVPSHGPLFSGVREDDGLLVTEAVRGEGATLLDASGERFTDELEPRDAVTLAILAKLDEEGSDHVRLDLRGLSEERFPNVFSALRVAGFDPAEPVPVAPASHYVMGGVSHRPGGTLLAAGTARRRGVRVHGPAWREPPRLQQPQRVLRPRRASRRRRARGRLPELDSRPARPH